MNILGESSSWLLVLLFVDCSRMVVVSGLVMVMVHEFYLVGHACTKTNCTRQLKSARCSQLRAARTRFAVQNAKQVQKTPIKLGLLVSGH